MTPTEVRRAVSNHKFRLAEPDELKVGLKLYVVDVSDTYMLQFEPYHQVMIDEITTEDGIGMVYYHADNYGTGEQCSSTIRAFTSHSYQTRDAYEFWLPIHP